MSIEIICEFLAWCSVINVGLLLFWLLWFTLAHDFVYQMHGKWLKLSVERFDGGMTICPLQTRHTNEPDSTRGWALVFLGVLSSKGRRW
jgi:hypothetical protein